MSDGTYFKRERDWEGEGFLLLTDAQPMPSDISVIIVTRDGKWGLLPAGSELNEDYNDGVKKADQVVAWKAAPKQVVIKPGPETQLREHTFQLHSQQMAVDKVVAIASRWSEGWDGRLVEVKLCRSKRSLADWVLFRPFIWEVTVVSTKYPVVTEGETNHPDEW